ncbi:MAG: UDP-N-acetylmuramoyl-L-alanyl-D-glutamate--2,6-diaminopimelate ligase [Hydrogenophaga sp.]
MVQVLSDPQAVADWLRERVTGGLQCDSRRIGPGDGFVAWPGAATDGRRFVASALAAGAVAALVEREGLESFGLADPRILAVPGLKSQAGPIASAFYRDPGAAMDLVGITGTNGKTSCAWWLAQVLSALERPCAVVGTLGIGLPPVAGRCATLASTGMTTPDPVLLQSSLRVLADQGVRAVAMEASSIGIVEGRLNATRLRVAVFTNFTQDHLDFHGSMDAYWSAKAALFDWPGLPAAVVNTDDDRGVLLAQVLAARGLDLWTVGIETAATARLFARDIGVTHKGMHLTLGERDANGQPAGEYGLSLPLVGHYNVANLLCVLAAARALGVPLPDAVRACAAMTAVPGRMQPVGTEDGQPLVLVDYAHTPDALEKALQALQPVARQRGGRLWCVIGCGGDRDPGKRPLMAAVAEREAQQVVLTSDNPRSEEPLAILAQMRAGLSRPGEVLVQADRAEAIALSVQRAAAHDVVLVAGKGHEDYQEVMGVKRPFSDWQQAQRALQARAAGKGASL